jgi:hypothetical protein
MPRKKPSYRDWNDLQAQVARVLSIGAPAQYEQMTPVERVEWYWDQVLEARKEALALGRDTWALSDQSYLLWCEHDVVSKEAEAEADRAWRRERARQRG